MLGAYNVTPVERWVPLDVLWQLGIDPAGAYDNLAGAALDVVGDAVRLAPYQAVWVT